MLRVAVAAFACLWLVRASPAESHGNIDERLRLLDTISAVQAKQARHLDAIQDKLENNEENLDSGEGNTNKKGDWDPYSSSFNDSYKDFDVKNFPTAEKEIKKKNKKPVVKTKIGQFKPSLSPKSPKTPEESKVKEKVIHRLTFDKPIVDLKYEVKEQ